MAVGIIKDMAILEEKASDVCNDLRGGINICIESKNGIASSLLGGYSSEENESNRAINFANSFKLQLMWGYQQTQELATPASRNNESARGRHRRTK